ncbi:MAG: hypothetical protein LBN06_11475 [Prevotellaceae bacterium]|jgi:hypothetical protein|nr:hypothetical protein [Prevotellaceae bacterium]
MNYKFEKTLVAKILSRIPVGENPVTFLMNTLSLSRESVYRRIRGDNMFSFGEIVTLSKTLGFSIDRMADSVPDTNVVFHLFCDTDSSAEETFIQMLHILYSPWLTNTDIEKREVTLSLNKIYPVLFPGHPHLMKYFYYQWMYEIQKTQYNFSYDDVELPQSVLELSQSVPWLSFQTFDVTIISEKDMVVNTLRKVDYFHRRNLISAEATTNIKNDLASVVDRLEQFITIGNTRQGGRVEFYLSMFDIPSNSIYANINGRITSFLWVDPANLMSTSNPTFCHMHARWLESLKIYSTSISQSNHIAQSEFFSRQRKFLDSILI